MGRHVFIGHCPGLSDAVSHLGEEALARITADDQDIPPETRPWYGDLYEDIKESLLAGLVDASSIDPELRDFVDRLIASITDSDLLEVLTAHRLTQFTLNDHGFFWAEVEMTP